MANFSRNDYNGILMISSCSPLARCACAAVLIPCLLLLISCGGGDSTTTTAGPVSKIVISPTTASIQFGQKQTFFPVPTDASGNSVSGLAYTWTSSAPTIASVDNTGVATGLANGTATITAAASGITSNTATLTVTQRVATVTISPMSTSVAVGGTKQFTATAVDSSGNPITTAPIAWFCSFAPIATIDNTGLVTGVSPGTVTIVASVGNVSSQPAALTVTP